MMTGRMLDMIDEVTDIYGYGSVSAVIRQAIIDMHTRAFKYKGVVPSKKRSDRTAEEVFEDEKAQKELKADVYEQQLLDMAKQLEGEIIERSGIKYCIYHTYVQRTRYKQELPLSKISRDLVDTQYQPSKEKVMALRDQGKTDY